MKFGDDVRVGQASHQAVVRARRNIPRQIAFVQLASGLSAVGERADENVGLLEQ